MAEQGKSGWFANGDAYEHYVGRWSRHVGEMFLDWLDLPSGLTWIDVGCGTGALTETILTLANPRKVIGVEPSDGFLQVAQARVVDDRVEFKSGDAISLPIEDSTAGAAVSGLVLNFVPDGQSALRELCRVVQPGGTVALYVWDYAGEMQLMRYFWDAVSALFPESADLDEGRQFPICDPEELDLLFRSATLRSVEVTALDAPTVFAHFDDYWSPFLRGQGPAGAFCASLSESDQERLRSHLENRVPISSDGSIHMIARAFAVKLKPRCQTEQSRA
ncbi:MAG: methyltransferase domain-containing protein [Chloroflexi bacterium]|nr:methyltransferase domain-containing protein [Chloroflexota bacterium]